MADRAVLEKQIEETKLSPLTVFVACELGLVDEMKDLLENSADNFDINALDEDEYSLLMIAAKYGHSEIMKLLLAKDADVNVKGHRNMTALLVSCQNGFTSTTKLLLESERRVDFVATDLNGNNALMYASMSGSSQIAEMLIKAGIDIEEMNEKKGTALTFGVLLGKENLVEYLLENNAASNAQDGHGNTALHLAATLHHTKIIKLLKENGARMDVQNTECKVPKQMCEDDAILKMFES